MPYLRLYSAPISIAQKRHIARKLIETTLRTFPLATRHQITIQFLPLPRNNNGCRLDVRGQDLTFASRTVFTHAVVSLLNRALHLKVRSRLAELLALMPSSQPKVEVRFFETPVTDGMIGSALIRERNDSFATALPRAA